MARTATGIDIGLSTAKVLRGHVKGNTFVATGFAVANNGGDDLESGWDALELGFKPTSARIGVTGREVNIRYTRVPRVPDWQLRKLMRFETEEISSQADAAVASDFNVLPEIPEIEGEDVVLLAMARESLLEDHLDGLARHGGKIDAFTPNAIGLYNAWLHYGVLMEDTVLVANIGKDNVDVIVCRGSDLLFARNLTGGSKLFDDALVERFQVSAKKAEEIKTTMVDLEPGASFTDPTAEKASRAMMGPAGQVLSLLQSTVLFCKSQIKLNNLKLDRVMICGGGAALPGLDSYLRGGMSVPVEVFDPFTVVDVSGLDPESADALEEHRMEAVVALGLAHSASDPDSYSIEILPEAILKKRNFMEGTVFLIAAAVLAVAFLGFYGWKNHDRLGAISDVVSGLRSRVNRVTGVDQDTRGLVEDNMALHAFGGRLHATVGSGEQLARALAVIDGALPRDFWIEQLTSTFGDDNDWNVQKGEEVPILRVMGRAREGTETPTVQFDEFVAALRAELPGVKMKEQFGSTGSTFTITMTVLAPPEPVLEDAEEEE